MHGSNHLHGLGLEVLARSSIRWLLFLACVILRCNFVQRLKYVSCVAVTLLFEDRPQRRRNAVRHARLAESPGSVTEPPSALGASRMKLVGPLARGSPGLRLALALEIERHCRADEILQGRLIDLVAFVDVDGAPGIPVEAGVE